MCNEGVVVVHALAFLVGAGLWRWACDVIKDSNGLEATIRYQFLHSQFR